MADGAEPGMPPEGARLPAVTPDGAGLRWSFELDLVSVLEAMGRPLRDWDGVDQEADLAAETEALGLLDAPPTPADALPADALPADARPADARPADALPADARPEDARPEDARPEDARPEDARPAPGVDAGHGADAAAGVRLDGPAYGQRPGARGADISGAVAEALPTGPGLAAWLAGQDPATATSHDLTGMAGAFRRLASWAQAGELELISHLAARSAAADPKAGLQADGRPAFVTDDAAAQVSLELVLSRPGAEAWTGLAIALRWRLPQTAAALAEGRIDTYRAKIIAEAVAPLTDDAAREVEDRVIPAAGDMTYGQLHAAVRRAVIAADPEGAEHRRQAAERRSNVSLYPDQDGTAALTGTCLPALEAAAAYARICAIAQAMKAAGAGGGIPFLRAQALLGLILQTLPPIPPPAGGPPDADPPPDDADDGWTPGPTGEPPHQPEPGPEPGPKPGPRPQPGPRPGPGDDPGPDAPPLTDADLPADDGYRDTRPPPDGGWGVGCDDWDPRHGDPLDDHFAPAAIQWPWPVIPATVPAIPGSGRPGSGRPGTGPPGGTAGRPPPGGLLDLTLPWATFTGQADALGTLGRIGPVTAPQARQAVNLALRDPCTQWRVIVTDTDGRAIAVARVARARPDTFSGTRTSSGTRTGTSSSTSRGTGTGSGDGQPEHAVTIGRVTIVLPARALDTAPNPHERLADRIYARILAAGRRACAQAERQAEADRNAPGGCAHTTASLAYRPPPRIREYVVARDQTCRDPRCRQPAWRGDLDHTVPFDHGGRTCPCGLGSLCRHHHQLKQRPGWTLAQPRPGVFRWTTPAGRSYTSYPDQHFTG